MRKLIVAIAVVGIVAGTASATPLLNEFMPNPAGTDPDPTPVELLGTPFDAFSGWILSIESDYASTGTQGTVDRATQVSGTFDVNGLLVVDIPDLENPSFTVVLLDSFTGVVGTTDIDTDDDGIPDDTSTFGTVWDALGSPDAVGDEPLCYGAELGGVDMLYVGSEPQNVFRDSVTLDWYAQTYHPSVFDAFGTEVDPAGFDIDPLAPTFGAVNPTIPEPATIALLGFGLALIRRR